MTLRFTILGLLQDRPMHGYLLKHALAPALPRDQQLNDGILYPLLARLESEGLVSKEVHQTPGRPPRNTYSPTARGRRAFGGWLRDRASDADDQAYDFLLGHPFVTKCIFFSHLTPAERRRKLLAQRGAECEKLREFRRIRGLMVRRGVDPFRIAVLDLGLAQQRGKLRWLDRLLGAGRARATKGARR